MVLSYGDFEAWLECDGEKMPVYDPKTDTSSREATCFILAEMGKTFSIHWKDSGSGVTTAAYIELDGVTIPGKFLHGTGTTWRSGMRTGVESERPFVFANVPDDDPKTAPKNYSFDLQKCGKISLLIKKVTLTGKCHANAIDTHIPEPMRGKQRMFPLAISYASAKPTGHQHELTEVFEPFDKTNPGPEVTFVFRYRDLEWMIINGHNVPRNMLPPPEPPTAWEKRKTRGKKDKAREESDTPSPSVKRAKAAATSSRKVRKTLEGQTPSGDGSSPQEAAQSPIASTSAAPTPSSLIYPPSAEPSPNPVFDSAAASPDAGPSVVRLRKASISKAGNASASQAAAHASTSSYTAAQASDLSSATKTSLPSPVAPAPTTTRSALSLDLMTLTGQHDILSNLPNASDISRWIDGVPSQWGEEEGKKASGEWRGDERGAGAE